MKKVIYIILVLGLIAAAYGYYEYNRPVAGIENDKVEASIASAALLTEYETNEENANKKYFDKVIEVKGMASKIGSTDGKSSIYLNAGSDLSYIICELEDAASANDIKVGDTITVKGKCTGYLSDVILVQSVIKD